MRHEHIKHEQRMVGDQRDIIVQVKKQHVNSLTRNDYIQGTVGNIEITVVWLQLKLGQQLLRNHDEQRHDEHYHIEQLKHIPIGNDQRSTSYQLQHGSHHEQQHVTTGQHHINHSDRLNGNQSADLNDVNIMKHSN